MSLAGSEGLGQEGLGQSLWPEELQRELSTGLVQGAAQLGVTLSELQVDQLTRYLHMMAQWGRVYNLTAILEPQAMLTHHVLDSLAVVPHLDAHLNSAPVPHIVDVGSGAGLPGVVLAVTRPNWHITCVDAVAKKAAFVQQVAAALGLANLTGVHSRVEALRLTADVVVSRAFASLTDFVACTEHLLKPSGVWLAMKGQEPRGEIEALPSATEVFHVEPLTVPALQAERCLVWMRQLKQAHPI